MDRFRLGDIGKQSQGEVLLDYEKRPKTTRARDGELGADLRGHRAPVEAGGPVVRMIDYLRALAARLRELFGDRKADRELNDEVETHMRLLAERYVLQGMSKAEAAWAARRQFGNVTLLKEVNREMHGIRFIDTFFLDLRYGARMLGKNPGFTFVAALTLALGIGANTAIFSVIEAVLLRPLPYQNSERLCVLWKSVPARNIEWDWTSYPTIRDWREQSRSFEDMAVFLRPDGSEVVLQSDAGHERIQGSKVSGNFFEMLGVRPLIGRAFSDEEARRGDDVVVLSYDFWQRRFGGDGAALGRSLKLDNRSVTVIGVMPPRFQFPDKNAQLWLLISADDRWAKFQEIRLADAFSALARLKPGVSIEEARADMNAVAGRLAKQYPSTDANLGIRVTPLFDQIAGAQLRRALWILGGAVLCVLLIACSNIASLLVARGATRRKELAVRAALGAGRWRLLRQLATESTLLSLLGGLGGLLFAHWALRALLALVPEDLPRADGIAINGTALAFAFTLCLLTGVVFGLLPALQITRGNFRASLNESGRNASAGAGVRRARGLLVAAQFTLAIVLLAGAGLMIRSFLRLDAVKPG
jgi:putative ABC transport system permease protein